MAKRFGKKQNKKRFKNYNPTNKEVFVFYECSTCHRRDSAIIGAKVRVNIPFFIQCGCGGWVMYQRAWITEPYTGAEIMIGLMYKDEKIINALQHELKDVTNILAPNGTMGDMNIEMQKPEIQRKFKKWMNEQENKKVMYR